MFFSIEPSNGLAIYEQIVRQVKFAIAEQTLRPGQLLPSIRTDGILESIRGKGLAVHADAPNNCVDARKRIITDRIKSVISEALHAGLEPDELRALVAEQISALAGRVETVSSQATTQPTLNG
jgi:GntR family transcriptional regulator